MKIVSSDEVYNEEIQRKVWRERIIHIKNILVHILDVIILCLRHKNKKL